VSNTYTIKIAPAEGGKGPSITVTAALGPDGPRVVELVVQPGAVESTLPAELADLDFGELLRAAAALAPMTIGDGTPHPAATDPHEDVAPQLFDDAALAVAGLDRPRTRRKPKKTRNPSFSDRRPTAGQPPADLGKMYWRLGSVAKVARHYEVSNQMVKAWIQILREAGEIPNPWRDSQQFSGANRKSSSRP
jgi:hypothetical protein